MSTVDNIEFFLVDTTGVNNEAISAGMKWLMQNGGGTVTTKDKATMENVLNVTTDGEFKNKEADLERYGIVLNWQRRGLPRNSKNILAVYTDKSVDDIVRCCTTEKVFFIPWTKSEANWFKTAYMPTIVDIRENSTLVPSPVQLQPLNTEGLISEKQDEILQILAREAAGYGNNLQWREIERFKAELINERNDWIKINPKDAIIRCIDLGMSAKDADAVGSMIKRLQAGHTFRPKRGYENGWRHLNSRT